VQIAAEQDAPRLLLEAFEPDALLVQAGGPPREALASIVGRNGFCDLVRFAIAGLPAGVRASIPVGFPGQTVRLVLWAEPDAPRAEDAAVTIAAMSNLPDSPTQTVRVTVLPALGDIRFRVVSGGWLSGAPIARFEVDGRVIYQTTGGGPGRGFNFLTVNAQSGELSAVRNFDTWASEEAVAAMEVFLQSLPEGEVVLAAVADDGWLLLTDDTRRILRERLGSRLIDALAYQSSWAIISRAGAAQPIAEDLRPDATATLDRTLTFPMP
jgi:hypothetical protein